MKIIKYSEKTGQCILENVRVVNDGIDWDEDHLFWKHEVKRKESLNIILHGHSRFIAKNIKIEGDLCLEVPDGMEMVAQQEGEKVVFHLSPLEGLSPFWTYKVEKDLSIKIEKTKC